MKPLFAALVVALLLSPLAPAQPPESRPDMDKLLDKLTFTRDKASLPYRLLKPDGYDNDGKASVARTTRGSSGMASRSS
jgi:hypothetical protein